MVNINEYEAVIIGGSYAGLSAAMALGRSLRKVLIIDNGSPCNIQTPHSHNFLTQDGQTPGMISSISRQQVEKYETIKFHQGLASNVTKSAWGFEITTSTNEKFAAKKIILATGIKDLMPDIKGFPECWGISVIHCPYCHGYEFRNAATGILANAERGFHLASLVNNLTKDLSLLTNGKADFNEEQIAKMNDHHIKVIQTDIIEVKHDNGRIRKVIFADGTEQSFNALYAALPFLQQSEIPASLGCELTEHGYIKVTSFQETNISGVYACGDNSNMMRSIANAVHTGNLAGAVVNGMLVQEKF